MSSFKIDALDLRKFLPREPVSTQYKNCGEGEIAVFSYGAALDKTIKILDKGFLFVQGYIPNSKLDGLVRELLSKKSANAVDFPESFCALLFYNNSFSFMSSVTAADQLFFYEGNDGFYVTNRHNLLGAVRESLTLRKESFWWMAGRTHIGDSGTYWNEISRSRPFRKYFYENGLNEVKPDYRHLFEPIPNEDLGSVMEEATTYFKNVFDQVSASKRLSLTGGKDSRGILGLLSGTDHGASLKINTTGNFFSPDVMAATKLTDSLGLSGQHSINRPKLSQTPGDYAEKIAEDLYLDFVGKSLADISKFSFSGELVTGGHEVGIKSPLNARGLEEFVKNRRFWCDDRGVLRKNEKEFLTKKYQKSLTELLSEVPVRSYDKIEGLEFRVMNRNSPSITASHIGGSQIHPFYDGKLLRLVCGMSEEAIKNHYIPYFFSSLAKEDIVSKRFADDAWPSELPGFLKKYGLVNNGRNPVPVTPYEFKNYFPAEKKFGMFSQRLELCELSASNIYSYLKDNKDFFDFLDYSTVKKILFKPSTDKTFREMYVHLGLLKSVIVHSAWEYAFSFDDFSKSKSLIEGFLDKSKLEGVKVSDKKDEISKLGDKIELYEKSIATMEEDIVNASDKKDSASFVDSVRGENKSNNNVYNGFSWEQLSSLSEGGFLKAGKDPLVIATISCNENLSVEGYLLKEGSPKQCAVIYFDGVDVQPFKSLVYSKTLKAYYRYLNIDAETGKFNIHFEKNENSEKLKDIPLVLRLWSAPFSAFVKVNIS
ncbi:hypothetical protein ACFO0U_13540 [Chromohalobacter sarecensis]|uniref:Asparagine synthetase domain-containing protein n=1 Tax=Chromohalobacter sarecensis TaxID=245294 RepID=A0ABV9D3F2_9GAMM